MKNENIEVFLSELADLKQKMGHSDSNLTPEIKNSVLKRQLFEYRQKEKQIQEEIEREIEDFFSTLHMKKAGIEALKSLGEYVGKEISRLEKLVQVEKAQ
jgi:hypothetical protein